MPRPLPVDYLQPDEEVLHDTGRHPLSVLDEVLGMFVLLAVVAGATAWAVLAFVPELWPVVGLPVVAGAGLAFLAFVVARYWRVTTSRYVITPERTYKAYGRLRFMLLQTTYDKVTDLHVRQSLFGRIWGFGTVRLETAGTGISLDGVLDPFGYKQRIESARSGFLHRLVAQHVPRHARPVRSAAGGTAAAEAAEGSEAPPAERETLWTGRPSIASFLGNGVQAGASLLVGLLFLTGAAVGDGRFVYVAVAFVAFGALGLWGAWVRYRYTRYLVEDWGVVVTAGWLTRRRVETTYDKVTDVTVYQGVVGRVLGYGNITINTAGSNQAPVVFAGLRAPESAKDVIDAARRRREGRA